jgi:adenine phosphoribosyltransferase
MNLKSRIRTVMDFPKPGIGFKDITPLLSEPEAFRACVDGLLELVPADSWDRIMGIESRGFLFGATMALQAGKPFIPARKPGKLPWKTVECRYELEYGFDSLHVHADALKPGERVLIVDDLLATGGTLLAAADLVRQLGGSSAAALVVVELDFLPGRKRLEEADLPLHSLIHFSSEEDE